MNFRLFSFPGNGYLSYLGTFRPIDKIVVTRRFRVIIRVLLVFAFDLSMQKAVAPG